MICPNGHESQADDFCDTCGAKIDASRQPAGADPGARPAPDEQACPNCQTVNLPDALFCEACGYDFTTGALPRGAGHSASLGGGWSLGGEAGPQAGASAAAGPSPDPLTPPPAPEGPEGPEGSEGPEGPEGPDGDGAPAGSSLDLSAPVGAPVGGETPESASAAPVEGPDEAGEGSSAAPAEEAPAPGEAAPQEPLTGPGPVSVAPSAPAALEWVAEVWVDPEWYAGQEAEEPMPSPGLPTVVPLRGRSLLVGRVSASRNIHPDLDCTSDTGVSRRHAQLTTDGSRWFVEDLASSNGTFVGPASGPLPVDPIPVGPKTELGADDRVYVGAWTRIVVRRATDDEVLAQD